MAQAEVEQRELSGKGLQDPEPDWRRAISVTQLVAYTHLRIRNSWNRRPMRLWRTIHASRGRADNRSD